MHHLKSYLKFHLKIVNFIYRTILLRFDKGSFAALFNLKSVLTGRSARVAWDGAFFSVTDKKLPAFRYRIRHQRQCDLAYQAGVENRAESLGGCYFLDHVDFKDGDVFFDCGANVGDMKIWFELRNLEVEYVGFEPSPIEFECLKQNVSPSVVHNVGLWNQEGELTFYVSSQGADSSLIEPQDYDEKIITRTFRLEDYVDRPIKCLKLEAEGAEPEILEGLGDALGMVEYISADLGFERGVNAESTLVPVTNFLHSNGFELVVMGHDRICALFKRKNTAPQESV